MTGQVYKVHSDKYFVRSEGKTYSLKARGVLKIKSDGISVGDSVQFDEKTIISILPRKNHFIRPNVSNVDLIVAVVSPEPEPDYYLVDKLLIGAVKENVDFAIVVNKRDIDDTLAERVKEEYSKLDLKVYSVCTKTKYGLDSLRSFLSGKLTVLAGQSAVGKTSLVNALFGLDLKTGELSEKISRGKHTTTRSEIFEYGDVKIVDTPGFAVIDADVSIGELPECYPEYFEVACDCKFRGCSHINEPQCKVKELVNKGELSSARYTRYKEIYRQVSERRENYEKD